MVPGTVEGESSVRAVTVPQGVEGSPQCRSKLFRRFTVIDENL